ncbi:DNA-directed RNA polymerase I subunit RPA1, partial [Gryllus bimaculatus]
MAKSFNAFSTRSVKHLDPTSVEFTVYHPDEIKEMSVVKVSVPVSFNALGLPMKGGLYDPVMGPLGDRGEICATCRGSFFTCPGHFGHIELPVPVFNPFFMKTVYSVLRLACLNCHELQILGEHRYLLIGQLQLLDAGHVVEAQELAEKLISINSSRSDVGEAAASAFAKESVKNYIDKVLGEHNTKMLGAEESKNVEILRAQFLAMAKEQFKQKKFCLNCKKPIAKITLIYNRLMTVHNKIVNDKIVSSSASFITPDEARNHLRALWTEGSDFIMVLAPVLRRIKSQYPTDVFFVEIVPVPPPKVRPVNFVKGKMNEHPQTIVFQQVLEHSIVTRQAAHIVNGGTADQLSEEGQQLYQTMPGASPIEKLHNAWQSLQAAVGHLVDAELNNTRRNTANAPAGLKQVISKKEGLIRMHMMGKRVNFAARTVITPDPNLGVDEIGIPEAFAKVLTYPTPVTPWNVDDLRQAVLNGPNIYPGATMVQNEDGSIIRVSKEAIQRASLAKRLLTPKESDGKVPSIPKIVHRHLRNGDVLLLNRQPTLHRPSIMAHRARVLHGEKTFRLHYANCKSYNADFDGDEMNAHFPQSELARAEAYFLAQVGHQYLVPKDGTPLSGLIQDHVVSGVRLTVRGRFFPRAEYCTLVQQALPTLTGSIRLLPPSILKPCSLWSGKQVVSTVLLNCIPAGRPPPTLCDSAKIPARAWVQASANRPWRAGGTSLRGDALSEAEVVLREGELLCGVLDKKHFGSTPYGLAHCVHELYGAEYCMKLLSAFARLFTAFLQREGFTLGVRDILVVPEADAERRKLLEEASQIGPSAVATAFELAEPLLNSSQERNQQEQLPPGSEAHLLRIATGDQQLRAALDHSYKQLLDPATNGVSRACVPAGLLEKFPENNLQLMVQSGAKGSTVNTLQISCLLGQIELEGRRPPLMPSGKALPSFRRFDLSPRAGGFVAGRFLTGIRPQEFFFHCMAGREGLIDTAVKTSRSGYLQRCLVKHLEGLVVGYDGTVRDSDGSLVQFAYGEDGLDILKSQFLTPKQIPVLADNYKAFYDKDDVSRLKMDKIDPEIEAASKNVRRWFRRNKRLGMKRPPRTFRDYSHPPDPIASRVPPCAAFEALTERLEGLINDYLKKHQSPPSKDNPMRDALLLKSVCARAEPGEPVGVLAAQSIGEPSTQMTLNTFHFAGRGEMNVTLGIPRLREVLMMASRHPKTPAMEVPMRADLPNMAASADSLRRRLRRSHLSELLEKVDITEWLDIGKEGRKRIYRIHMQFLPKKELRREHSVSPNQVLQHVESHFLANLVLGIRKLLRTSSTLLETKESRKEGQTQNGEAEDPEKDVDHDVRNRARPLGEDQDSSSEDENEEEEEDATSARNRARHNESHEYDQPEGSEDEQSNNGENVNESFQEERQTNSSQNNEYSVQTEEINRTFERFQKDNELKKRVEKVLSKYKLVTNYMFDLVREQWCEVTFGLPLSLARVDFSTIFREVAEQSVVCSTPGIKRAFVNSNPDGSLVLRTDGTNLPAMFKYVDIRDVFKAYGITVDPRHLLLVADYMTFLGTYEPLSKRGIESASSPLQQMSFESSLSFLQTATLRGRRDTLQSPSSRIMLGRPCGAGTDWDKTNNLSHSISVMESEFHQNAENFLNT